VAAPAELDAAIRRLVREEPAAQGPAGSLKRGEIGMFNL
jgi:hypothetical protein